MGDIRGVSICRNDPRLTHLLFANDSLIFCKAKENECQKLLEVLATYENVSGQQINREKTTIFFSKSTSQALQNTIKAALRVPVVQQYEKYLDLPSFIGQKKKEIFDNIKQKVWKKLQGWEGKLLSQARREILIKAMPKHCPHTQCHVSNCPMACAMILRPQFEKHFGDKEGKAEKSTGLSGQIYANRKHKVEWISKIFQGSTMPSLQNKLSTFYMIKPHCF